MICFLIPANKQWFNIISAIPFLCVIILNISSSKNKILNSKIFTFLGEISFCVYILHVPLHYLMQSFGTIYMYEFEGKYIWIIYLFLLLTLSTFIHLFYEVPINSYLRRKFKTIKC